METRVASKQPQWLEKPVRLSEQKWPEGTKPVVSIFCLTYNHEKFIRDALEGFLMQETTFPVEIFVHDDASKDKTQEVLREYEAKIPGLFQMVLQKENQWSARGTGFLYELLQKMKGEFTSLCEGDDFWTDKRKLQKQHEILRNYPECVLVGGLARTLGSSHEYIFGPREHKETYELKELFDQGIHTSTYFYRTKEMRFPGWVLSGDRANGDIIIQTLAAQKGPVRMIPEVLSVYRIHAGGIWSGTGSALKIEKNQATWDLISAHLGYGYASQIRAAQIRLAKAESKQCMLRGQWGEGFRVFWGTSRRYWPAAFIEILKWLLCLPFWPWLGIFNQITPRIALRTRLKKIKASFAGGSAR